LLQEPPTALASTIVEAIICSAALAAPAATQHKRAPWVRACGSTLAIAAQYSRFAAGIAAAEPCECINSGNLP